MLQRERSGSTKIKTLSRPFAREHVGFSERVIGPV